LNRNDKLISSVSQRRDIAGFFGIIIQRLPDFSDSKVDSSVEITVSIFWPKLIFYFFARHKLIGAAEKHYQKVKGLSGKSNQHSCPTQLAALGV